MSVGLRSSSHAPLALLIILPVLVALPGCGEDFYSESMLYPVRTDPVIVMSKLPAGVTGQEMLEPDRPGQFLLPARRDLPGRDAAGSRLLVDPGQCLHVRLQFLHLLFAFEHAQVILRGQHLGRFRPQPGLQ